ncbi:BTAD domain-containing putative transcriptional regulator [Saccharothrix sp. Mg75]|uniref:AfsR/SARP family transcriptional regulator n=1 Tax=Saccharothrix sp. Mg75 TaxID=3445357 RepID=UPI003EED0382
MEQWSFGVLGEFSVSRNGHPVPLPGGKLRVLLGALLLRAGQPVSEGELVERLWDEPPLRARSTLHVYVVRLRRALAAGGAGAPVISRSTSGYRIEVDAGQVDALRFRALLPQGGDEDSGDPQRELDRLREALALWRGPALTGVPSDELQRGEAARLEDERTGALERRMELELATGRHQAVVGELRALVARYPLSEVFLRQLMLALHRAGRSAEALGAYRDAHRRFVAELGVEPGARTTAVHEAVLRGDADDHRPDGPPPARVRELPPRSMNFCGRAPELEQLDDFRRGPRAARVITVVGAPGVGKTALALQWAHRVSPLFPDGQLFVDLRGYSVEQALTPAAALARMTRALGVGNGGALDDLDEASSAYRSALNDRRVLVLLDNADSVEQVRPLLPGGPDTLTVVTSRNTLRGLVAIDDARSLALGPLADADAHELFGRILGERRAAAEPAALAELVRLCGGLPLAIRVAAVDLVSCSGVGTGAYLDGLRSRGALESLVLDDDARSEVRLALDLSFRKLPEASQAFFRALGQLPAMGFTAVAAAGTAGVGIRDAERHLDRLVAVNLLRRSKRGFFALNRIVREYARGAGSAGGRART